MRKSASILVFEIRHLDDKIISIHVKGLLVKFELKPNEMNNSCEQVALEFIRLVSKSKNLL